MSIFAETGAPRGQTVRAAFTQESFGLSIQDEKEAHGVTFKAVRRSCCSLPTLDTTSKVDSVWCPKQEGGSSFKIEKDANRLLSPLIHGEHALSIIFHQSTTQPQFCFRLLQTSLCFLSWSAMLPSQPAPLHISMGVQHHIKQAFLPPPNFSKQCQTPRQRKIIWTFYSHGACNFTSHA